MSELPRHRFIWSTVGFLHVAAFVGVVSIGSTTSHLPKADEGGLLLVVVEDQSIVETGEVLDGLAVGKGEVIEQPVHSAASVPAATTVQSQPVISNMPSTAVPEATQAKVESRGITPAVFVSPAFLIRKEPIYPEKTRRAGIEGRVVVKIFLSNTGAIRATEVVVSSGNQALDQSAIQAVRASKFSPAQCDRVPVESHAMASYRFELR